MIKPDQHSAALMAVSLRTIAGVVLLTALCVAPLNFASTRLLPLETLMALTTIGGAAWLLSLAVGRSIRLPPTPALVGTLLLGTSGVAWCFFLTQPALPEFTRDHFARVVERWPYSVVPREFSLTLALAASAVLALFALTDFAREPAWRQAIATVLLVTGATVALLGLLQNASSARGIYWDTNQRMPGAFFGTFFHHTAAGAYLNTVWPIGLALGLHWIQGSSRTPRARIAVYGALGCTMLILAAHLGHISRFPQVIAAVMLLAFIGWAAVWRALGKIPNLRPVLLAISVVLVVAVISTGATRFNTIATRWAQLSGRSPASHTVVVPPPLASWPKLMRDDLFIPSDHRNYFLGDRGATYAAARAAIVERPWFGWGPGGWMAAAASHSSDPFVRTFYLTLQFTHNDFLQACVEWGLVGAAGWVLLVPAAAIHAVVKLGGHPSRDYVGAGAAAALAAVLVQSVIDFPLQIPAIQFNAIALAALSWTAPAFNPAASQPISFS